MSSAYNLKVFVATLESWGLTDVLLPFLLIFVIFYAILQKSNVLGNGKKNLNMGVSLVVALLVVIPHILGAYPPGADVVTIMNRALPNVSIVVVAVVMLLILLGIFGGDATLVGMKLGNWIAILAIIAILWIFGGAAGWWGPNWGATWRWLSSDVVAIIIILLVFGLIIAFVTSESGESNEKGYVGKLADDLRGMFKGN